MKAAGRFYGVYHAVQIMSDQVLEISSAFQAPSWTKRTDQRFGASKKSDHLRSLLSQPHTFLLRRRIDSEVFQHSPAKNCLHHSMMEKGEEVALSYVDERLVYLGVKVSRIDDG